MSRLIKTEVRGREREAGRRGQKEREGQVGKEGEECGLSDPNPPFFVLLRDTGATLHISPLQPGLTPAFCRQRALERHRRAQH